MSRGPNASVNRKMRVWMMVLGAAALVSACAEKAEPPRRMTDADPARGREAVMRLGCGACHTIPGVDWPQGRVGGPLAGFAGRPMIAGRLPNQPDVLIRWVQDAPSLAAETGMPAVAMAPQDARDVAAFLYTLK